MTGPRTTNKTFDSDAGNSNADVKAKVESHEKWISIILSVIVVSLFLVAVDLYKDNILHSRITELERAA